MFSKVFALKLQDVSDEQLPVVSGHLDKAGVETVGVRWIGDGIDPQHLDRGCKTHLFC